MEISPKYEIQCVVVQLVALGGGSQLSIIVISDRALGYVALGKSDGHVVGGLARVTYPNATCGRPCGRPS